MFHLLSYLVEIVFYGIFVGIYVLIHLVYVVYFFYEMLVFSEENISLFLDLSELLRYGALFKLKLLPQTINFFMQILVFLPYEPELHDQLFFFSKDLFIIVVLLVNTHFQHIDLLLKGIPFIAYLILEYFS